MWKFSSLKKKLFWKIKFLWSPTAQQHSKFPSGFRLKIFTWDPKIQFKRSKWPWEKICMKFGFWWNKHNCNFSLKNQKVSETSFLNFKNIPVTQRSLVFAWSFSSSNSRVGERSRESSFLLYRTTKLKHTDSISVPIFFVANSIGRKRVLRKRQYFDDSFLAWK